MIQIKKSLKNSDVITFSNLLYQGKFPGYKSRSLSEDEIKKLEANNNYCLNWNDIFVENDFTADHIRGNTFFGKNYLPKFFGTVMAYGGIATPTGIYNSTIQNSIIENSHINNVSLLSNAIVSSGVILHNVGSLICSGKTSFGIGEKLCIGSETGGRTFTSYPAATLDIATNVLMRLDDIEYQSGFNDEIESLVKDISSSYTFIGKNATVSNTSIVRNCWIGSAARIDGAIKLRNSCILSSIEQHTSVQDGAIVVDSILQWGAKIKTAAQLKLSIIMEESLVCKNALINNSIIGPNTHVEEAEITSSLVGPFVGLHHHSLLISAIWPEGCGNVGYGANVGSNHTGRLPDQEIRPGMGAFFGLGTSIKFPSNFQNAPFTLIATGITTLPQKVLFPFSLITEPTKTFENKPILNEIIPGWLWTNNSYALARNELKYKKRSKSRRQQFDVSILQKDICYMVLEAITNLKSIITIKEYYFETDIPGLGKNYLSESNRQLAIKYYLNYLERYILHDVMDNMENNISILESEFSYIRKKIFQGEIIKECSKLIKLPDSVPLLIKRFRSLEKSWKDSIYSSIEKDFTRGKKIFDDYELVHSMDDANFTFIAKQYENVTKRCNSLFKKIKNK